MLSVNNDSVVSSQRQECLRSSGRSSVNRSEKNLQSSPFPMLRHLPQPFHAGGLVSRIGLAGADVHFSRDGLVDEGLLLLLQQRDQLLLGADVALDAAIRMVEVADDGGLLGEGGSAKSKSFTIAELSPCIIEPFPALWICSFT